MSFSLSEFTKIDVGTGEAYSAPIDSPAVFKWAASRQEGNEGKD